MTNTRPAKPAPAAMAGSNPHDSTRVSRLGGDVPGSRPAVPWMERGLVLGLMLLAAIELVSALRAGEPAITERDWQSIESAIPSDAFAHLGTPWLGPLARRHVAALSDPAVVGAPDLRGHPRLAVVTLASDDTWPARVAAQLGLPTLTGQAAPVTSRHGALSLHVIELPDAEQITDSLAARLSELRLETPMLPGSRCTTTSREAACSLGASTFVTVREQFAEIDHVARRCTTVALEMQGAVRLDLPEFRFGTRLVGHVGVHDFNHRLRNDAATTLTFTLPNGAQWTATHTDRQGWAPFEVPTEPGPGPLSIDLTAGSSLRFDDAGELAGIRTLCLDLRGMTAPVQGEQEGE